MTNQTPNNSDNETEDNRSEIEKSLDRASKMQEERIEFGKDIDRRIDELGKKIEDSIAADERRAADTKNRIDELVLADTVRAREFGQQIGGLGNKFGRFAEEFALPSIKKILEEKFNADFMPELKGEFAQETVVSLLDAWGVARNGEKVIYLVEVKSTFRERNFGQIWWQVKTFRNSSPEYADYQIYPMVAVVDASKDFRRRIMEAGIYLIDLADGTFKLAESPNGFKPNGSYGMDTKDGGTSFFRMVPGALMDAGHSQPSS